MAYLFDTDAISEVLKKRPLKAYLTWLASVSREDLKVFVLGGECIVRGERKPPHQVGAARPIALERPFGPFERRFVIPVGSRVDELKARVTGGLLEIRIPMEGVDVPKEQKVELD